MKDLKSKVRLEADINDIVGRPILPGNVVAVSRSGRGSKNLEIHIVSSVTKDRVSFFGYHNKYSKKSESNYITPTAGYTVVYSVPANQHIVVLTNPLMGLSNHRFGSLLEIYSSAKDTGLIPKGLPFGKGFVPGSKDDSEG